MALVNIPLLLSNKQVLKEDTVNYYNDIIPLGGHGSKVDLDLKHNQNNVIYVLAEVHHDKSLL